MKDKNNSNCPCKRSTCEKHGNCKACKEHHEKFKRGMKTVCERIKEKKKVEKNHFNY